MKQVSSRDPFGHLTTFGRKIRSCDLPLPEHEVIRALEYFVEHQASQAPFVNWSDDEDAGPPTRRERKGSRAVHGSLSVLMTCYVYLVLTAFYRAFDLGCVPIFPSGFWVPPRSDWPVVS
jgi:hypothetical protein